MTHLLNLLGGLLCLCVNAAFSPVGLAAFAGLTLAVVLGL